MGNCFKPTNYSHQRRLAYVTGSTAGKDMASQRTFPLHHGATLVIKQGDITKESVDAIVNAANERMLGGGGVDGAIHRAAGPQLVRACAAVPETRPGVRCPTGEARITPGFNLPARHVIHTVGPVYEYAEQAAPLLASAYRKSMELAIDQGLASISFPAISTGVYGYPYEEAAEVALTAVESSLDSAGPNCSVKEVRFVLFGQQLYDVFVREAQRRASTASSSLLPPAATAAPSVKEGSEAATGSGPQKCEEL